MSEQPYDSTEDSLRHIDEVRQRVRRFCEALQAQAGSHDNSKLHPPEKEAFDVATPKLKGLTYGSPEYNAATAELGEALKHHYAHNRHHPEHFANGVNDMTLMDLVEMFCDWKAATLRHDDGDLGKSVALNEQRYGLTPQLAAILRNTKREMNW